MKTHQFQIKDPLCEYDITIETRENLEKSVLISHRAISCANYDPEAIVDYIELDLEFSRIEVSLIKKGGKRKSFQI